MNKGHAVIYDRASDKNQADNWSRADAERVGRQMAERHGYTAELRREIKSGETLEERPVIMAILKDIEAGRVQAIICQDFTRLSRDEDGIDGRVIRRVCRDNDCHIITPQKVYDFSQDADHDMADFEFLVGKIQKRANIRALVRGIQERARQGEWVGGRLSVGYRLAPTGEIKNRHIVSKLEIDPDEAQLIREIFSLFEKINANAIARQLNREGKLKPIKGRHRKLTPGKTHRVWDGSSIKAVIKNPIYVGWLTWGTGKTVRSRYMKGVEMTRHFRPDLQIIDQATFDRCQALLKERSRPRIEKDDEVYAFTGLVKCPLCGIHMVGNNRERVMPNGMVISRTYVCINRRRETDVCPNGKSFAESTIAKGLIPFTANVLKSILGRLRESLEATAREMSAGTLRDRLEAEVRAGIAECEAQEQNLARAVAEGHILPEQTRSTSQEIMERKARLKKDLDRLLSQSAIEQEFQAALSDLDGDLEDALLRVLKKNPLALNRILRFIYEKGSIELKPIGSPRWGRSSEVVGYKFTPEFTSLDQGCMLTNVP